MSMTIEDLTQEEREQFLEKVRTPDETRKRRKELADRVAIQTDQFDHLIRQRVAQLYNQDELIDEVARWAVGLFNPQKVAVRRIAVGYKRRPVRRIAGNKANSKLLTDFYRRIRFGKFAPRWHTMSVATNRVIVLAKPLRDRKGPTVGFQVIAGSNAEVIQESATTEDYPPGVLGVLMPSKRDDAVGRHDSDIMTVDSEWYLRWDHQGKLIGSYRHGLGRFPGAWMDHNGPAENDAFNGVDGCGMTKTVLEVGYIAAAMGWTRKTQCRKLISLMYDGEGETDFGDDDSVTEEKTVGDPEGVLSVDDAKVIVSDLDTAVTNFLQQIDELDRRAFEQLTGAPATPNPAFMQNPASAASQLHAAASEVHSGIVENLEAFEGDMAEVAVLMGQHVGVDTPPVEAVRDRIEVDFPPLPFLETPSERNKVWKDRIGLGVNDAVEYLMEITGMSEPEAEARIMVLAERQGRFNEVRARTHSRTDGEEADPGLAGEDDAQRTGRFGGRATPPPPNE